MNRKRVGILIFPNVEVLDFCGPYEVFSATRLDEGRRREEPSPFEVLLVAEHPVPVAAAGGMRVVPDSGFDACPTLDILVVPGGWGTRTEMNNARLIDWISARSQQVETVSSVCTGALLLGKAGLLDGHRATTHWRSLDWMRELFPAVSVEEKLRVVDEGRIVTSAGIAAGIDLALHVVTRYFGETVARATARHMEYPYPLNYPWTQEFPGSITVCDREGIILEMNDRSAKTFQDQGGAALVGGNLLDCHPEPAREKLLRIMETQRPNVYTIEKSGVKKLVYQAPWFADGKYAGLVEFVLEIPAEMPHFIRDGQPA